MKLLSYLFCSVIAITIPMHPMHKLGRMIKPLKMARFPCIAHTKPRCIRATLRLMPIRFASNIINSKNKYKKEPNIFDSITRNDVKEILEFYRTQPDVPFQIRDGATSLQYAATIHGSRTIMEILIAIGIPLNQKTAKGDTALHLAAQNSNIQAMKVLIKAGAELGIRNNDGKTALQLLPAGVPLQINDLLES